VNCFKYDPGESKIHLYHNGKGEHQNSTYAACTASKVSKSFRSSYMQLFLASQALQRSCFNRI